MIETARLLIRPYTLRDLGPLRAILTSNETMRFWPRPFTPGEVRDWIDRSILSFEENGYSRFPVVLRESGELIGDCGIVLGEVNGRRVHDLGYIIHYPHHRLGYAIEAAGAVMSCAFRELGIDALHANMAQDHHASRRVAEKLGMRYVETFNNPRNRNLPTLLYAIDRASAELERLLDEPA